MMPATPDSGELQAWRANFMPNPATRRKLLRLKDQRERAEISKLIDELHSPKKDILAQSRGDDQDAAFSFAC